MSLEILKELQESRSRAQAILDQLNDIYDDCVEHHMTATHDAMESASDALRDIDILIGEHRAFLRDEE